MKSFHILSVGIVLATALCGPANALDVPLESPVWTISTEVQKYELPRVYAPAPLDVTSHHLKTVYEVASEYGHPEVLQAMLMQESNGGTHPTLIGSPNAPISQRSYGVMQVQVATARHTLKRYEHLRDKYFPSREIDRVSDKEIRSMLLTNHRANIEVAAVLFDLYLQISNGSVDRAIAAYNVGIGGVKKLRSPSNFKYVREVRQKLKTVVKPFNEQYGLGTTNTIQPSVVLVYNK